ncbi:MAG: hypothetical protein JWP13_391 [Candidatus Saccharibacteria bacterium]|nr:hypothetical protein [Candidatus Saccharibacteria bacterium]
MTLAHGSGESGLYRDLSTLTNDRLVEEIMAHAQREDCPALLAGETLAETAEAAEYHLRIQRVQSLEEYQAGSVAARILVAAAEHYTKDSDRIQQFDTLDELVTRKKTAVVRTDTLNDLHLTKPEQVLFLRAVLIATTAREWEAQKGGKSFSVHQARVQQKALFALRHLATNLVYVGETSDEASVDKFAAAYASNYLARSVVRELHAQGRTSHSTTSIDAALSIPIAFGQLVSGNQQDVVSVFPSAEKIDSGNENLGFKPVYPIDIDEERLARLRNMQMTFGGPYTEFRYYDTIKPFAQKSEGHPNGEEGEPAPSPEDEPKEDYNYLVLEIVHPDHNDVMKTHVVADHPEKGNACYALREEVLDEWERLLGIRLSWRDVFTQSRATAQQLGARAFHHNKGSNVEARVHKYLRQDPGALIHETFARIFDREADLFDDAMDPTGKNRMPAVLIAQIRGSSVLKERWTAIRQYGYADLHRHEAAVERALGSAERPRERSISLAARAAEIFAKIIEDDSLELR